MKRFLEDVVRTVLPFSVATLLLSGSGPTAVSAQAVVVEHEGAAALGLALRRLGTTQRVLMIGAHPDDENTAVLSALALGAGADVAYLSLTRGEGGQNLIGPELQEGLGLIRSEELLAARRLDGARQFFTRAYDFGYSRTADETFEHWPRDAVLADVVEVVRRYRPDILISVFSGTPADGHGHHQVSGILARDAFLVAGDASRYADQIARGLSVHQPTYLFQAVWRPRGDEPLSMSTGDYDPLLGRSHFQIAMASRSRHRSQDMGQPEPIGPRQIELVVLAGDHPASVPGTPSGAGRPRSQRDTGGASLFAGLDTTLSQLAARTGSSQRETATPAHVAALRRYETQVGVARDSFNPLASGSTARILGQASVELTRADSIAAHADAGEVRRAIADEREKLDDALWTAAGLVVDAQADAARAVPGEELGLALSLWNGGSSTVYVETLEPALPSGWEVLEAGDSQRSSVDRGRLTSGEPLPPGAVVHRRFVVRVPAAAEPTEPYYLREPRHGDLYGWPDDPAVRGLPFEPPTVNATASVIIEGKAVDRVTEVVHVEIDKALGERRRPILVVPAIDVAVSPPFAIVPLAETTADGDAPSAGARRGGDDDGVGRVASGRDTEGSAARAITVEVSSEASDPIAGTVRLEAPAGWRVDPASVPVTFNRRGDRRELRFTLQPPGSPTIGQYAVRAVFETAGGRRYDRGHAVIEYPHTRPRTLYRDAITHISAFPVAVAGGLRVGYIEGAGDDGVLALRQLGAEVTPLDTESLARGALSRFHAIVLGVRAYEVRPDLITHNDRLLEYARGGGTVIVQYNKYEYVDGGFAPFPLTMARPHGRVTDENAPVGLLDPGHAVLSWPNRITRADFDGWVQERGLYFADTWDESYTPLLEMADPGMEPLRGGLLVARTGEGWYAYTGLALFRQLPERVPGAYRLLANLVSLGRD